MDLEGQRCVLREVRTNENTIRFHGVGHLMIIMRTEFRSPLTLALIVALFVPPISQSFADRALSVREYGAKGDGATKDTAAIQKAIDAAAKQGGGTIHFPPGRYVSGTIHLKSRISVDIGPGASVMLSPEKADFDSYEKLDYDSHADNETTYAHHALFMADGESDISIYGFGEIDGNRSKRGGPKPIAFKNCKNVAVQNIRIVNAPNYCISLLGCDYARIDGVTIRHAFADGIDPDCSRYVQISNCTVESNDDAVCLKTSLALGKRLPTEHVAVTNCILSSSSNNFKMGTESSGDFRDIGLSNCTMFRRSGDKDNSGIAIESVDGSNINGVVVSNVSMSNVHNPIFIRLGNRGRGLNPPVPGTLRNISINGIIATGAEMTTSITGLAGHPVQDVHLENIRINMAGGGTKSPIIDVPEAPAKYPESNMFGELPAHGMYARHAANLTVRDLRIDCEKFDGRPAIVFDDVLLGSLKDVVFASGNHETPVLRFRNSVGITVQGCAARGAPPVFLSIEGKNSEGISLIGNGLKFVKAVVQAGREVPRSVVTQILNQR